MGELNLIPAKEWLENEKMKKEQLWEEEQKEFNDSIKNNNFWNSLDIPEDRVKADKDNNRKISYDEYKEYLLKSDQTVSKIQYNPNEIQHTYHLHYSFYIIIGMICLTTVIVIWLKQKLARY